jgi:hypothetical protein
VKHSLNPKKRSNIVKNLRLCNQDLKNSLENFEVPAEDSGRKVQYLKRKFSIQRCDSIRESLRSFHRALDSEICCTCSPPHQAAIDLDWTMYESDRANTFKVAMSYETNSQLHEGSGPWRTLCITSETTTEMANLIPTILAPSTLSARAPSQFSSIRTKVARFSHLSARAPPCALSPTTPCTTCE